MELQEALQKRRSVRSYQKQKVEEEKIKKMLEAAILAPSWKNSQVTRYYVVTGEEMLEKVKETLPEFNRKNVQDAPVLIVSAIIRDRSGFERDGTPSNELGNGWGYYDCGMQSMNLLLAAKEQGLDTLVMGIRDAGKIAELLEIPKEQSVVSVIGVGYSQAEPAMPKRKTVADIARFY
ncbi:nitroreductase [Blautia sp. An249]|uniref:nitroreductase family protein n=1 Tax=Blautia sp. An249 TaxID=1965603 RepID=UPI000B3ADBDD|nr:nitroreductase family protein [Blautia sp. An249]OUO81080.1 nitroreductase [Blautia sp. An249]